MAAVKPNRRVPFCGCVVCEDCNGCTPDFTALVISGASPGSPPPCANAVAMNGTRVFRASASEPLPIGCAWGVTLWSGACDGSFNPYRVGNSSLCVSPAISEAIITVTGSPGAYQVDVDFSISYTSPFLNEGSVTDIKFRRTSTTCSGLSGVLTWQSTAENSTCSTTITDYISLAGATVTLT